MIFGLNEKGERVPILKAIHLPKQKYVCPQCGGELIMKNGKIYAPHFAHKSSADCDTFTHDMSDWHKEWQEKFPEKNREVVIKLKISEFDYNWDAYNYYFSKGSEKTAREKCSMSFLKSKNKQMTIKHRADICINKYVIEFQHSPISQKEFNERNWFYTKAGYTLIWIFDFREYFKSKEIKSYDVYENEYDKGQKYAWTLPKKFMQNYIPQDNKKVRVIFQVDDDTNESFLGRVVWTIKEKDKSNFKRFLMSDFPKDDKELKRWVTYQKKGERVNDSMDNSTS